MNIRIIFLLVSLFNTISIFSQQLVYTVPRVKDYILIHEKYGTSGFENLRYTTYSFNEKENQTKRVEQNWYKPTIEWRNSSYEDFIYDSNNNLVEKKRHTFFTDTNSWVNNSKTINTFDDKGNMLTTGRFTLDRINNNWVPFDQTIFSYDLENNQIEYLYKLWRSDLNDWEIKHKTNFEYDNGLKVTSINSNRVGDLWVLSYKVVFSYNSNKSLIQELSSYWNSSLEKWMSPHFKTNFDFDSNENLIVKLSSEYKAGEWKEYNKDEFIYDSDKNQIEYVWSEKVSGRWKFIYKRVTDYYEDHFEKTINEFEWDYWDEAWKPTFRLKFSENATLGTTKPEVKTSFYPNPVEHKLRIISELDIIEVELYNTKGQRLNNVFLQDDFIDFTEISSGFYLLNIYFSKGKIVKRILKK